MRALLRHERDVARLGIPPSAVAIGDFDEPDSIAGALDGIDSAYLVTPSSSRAESQQIKFAKLAAAAGVRHIVKLSQLAAEETPPAAVIALTEPAHTGKTYTITGPAAITHAEIAGVLGKVIGRQRRFTRPFGS